MISDCFVSTETWHWRTRRMTMVKELDKHFNGKITVTFSTYLILETYWLLLSVCSTSHALAFLIFKEEWKCVTCLEVFPCICIWWKAWFHLCHLLLTLISSLCRNTKSKFRHLHAILMEQVQNCTYLFILCIYYGAAFIILKPLVYRSTYIVWTNLLSAP